MEYIHTRMLGNEKRRSLANRGKRQSGTKLSIFLLIFSSIHLLSNLLIDLCIIFFFFFPGNDRAEGSLAKDEAFCVMMLGLCIQHIQLSR